MGLDLIVEGCAKPGHEAEWREILQRSFDGKPAEGDIARFREICIPGFARLSAPRVGFDASADAWMLRAREATTPEQSAAILKEMHGYYVLALVDCDGVPKYSHRGLYEGVDETSFRGSLLPHCKDVLGEKLLEAAWVSKLPEAAITYGKALLAAADAAERRDGAATAGILSRLGFGRTSGALPLGEQLDIVRAAGRWYAFWGERGHAIRAWF